MIYIFALVDAVRRRSSEVVVVVGRSAAVAWTFSHTHTKAQSVNEEGKTHLNMNQTLDNPDVLCSLFLSDMKANSCKTIK